MFHLERPRFRSYLKTTLQTFAFVTHQIGPRSALAAPKSTIDDTTPQYKPFVVPLQVSCSATTSEL